jgi:hypothetical protein
MTSTVQIPTATAMKGLSPTRIESILRAEARRSELRAMILERFGLTVASPAR